LRQRLARIRDTSKDPARRSVPLARVYEVRIGLGAFLQDGEGRQGLAFQKLQEGATAHREVGRSAAHRRALDGQPTVVDTTDGIGVPLSRPLQRPRDMSELEVAKEQIAYLKFWLGVMVVTDISLFGWLVSNADSTSVRLLAGGCIAVVVITVGIVLLHRRIERQIQGLRGL
jgi:hypothetical protein